MQKAVDPEEYCRVRKQAYGFSGCHNCPIACPLQSNNLNELANIESEWIKEEDKPCLMTA